MAEISIERLRELAQEAALDGTRFGDDVERAVDELIVLREAIGDDTTQWVRNPTIEQKWGAAFEFHIEHDGDLWDAIAAARQKEAERDCS